MHIGRCSAMLLLLGPALGSLSPADGQTVVELGPVVGLYAPVGTLSRDVHPLDLPSKASQLAAVAWGVQGRLWLSRRLGAQILVAVASSRFGGFVAITPGGLFTVPQSHARIVTLAAEALWRPVAAISPLWLSAGAGIVRHGGAYAPYGSPSPLAASVGLGSAGQASESRPFMNFLTNSFCAAGRSSSFFTCWSGQA